MARAEPWSDMLAAVRARGEAIRTELEARAAEELELYPRKERKRIKTEWEERIRRSRRRVETGALDLALQVVALWYADLAALPGVPGPGKERRPHGGPRNRLRHRPPAAAGRDGAVEDTRLRFQLNVSEELACESLAYRLERLLAADAATRWRRDVARRQAACYLRTPAPRRSS